MIWFISFLLLRHGEPVLLESTAASKMPIISINEIQRVTPFLKIVLQRLREDEQSITTPRWPVQLEDSLSTGNQTSSAHVASIDSVEQKNGGEDEKANSDDKLPIIFDDAESVHSCNSEITRFSDYQVVPMDEDENENDDEVEFASRTYSFTELHDLLWQVFPIS
jgi:hypothetical protein